ncbi:MAG: hypothetical protein ABR973_18600 [Candidatus Acidiferrales bacterium]
MEPDFGFCGQLQDRERALTRVKLTRWQATTRESEPQRVAFFDFNLFCTSDRLVKSVRPPICDRGEGFAVFVLTIRRRVADGPRSRFRNSELCEGEIDYAVKIALTGATCLPVG